MLVDLARNDLGRVAQAGSVHVDPYRSIERYSHVMHIVSGVQGELAAGRDAFDLFAAAFPAGTLVGAPKVRAMELIDELEPVRRGIYAAPSATSAATATWTRPSRSARWCSAATLQLPGRRRHRGRQHSRE
jgi:anthranilate/para-aminobenzoate synthase component I